MGLFDFINPNIECVICGKESGANACNTKVGRVCRKCIDKLAPHGVSVLNIKKYDIDDLKAMCGYATSEPTLDLSGDGTAYEKLEKLIIQNPTISLKPGEVCFYMQPAKAFHQKNVVTGSKSKGSGVSVHVAKNVSVRTGGGTSTLIRQNIGEKFDGTLYITNMRISLLAPKYGFDVMIPKVTKISEHSDGLELYVGAKCYPVLTNDVKNILAIIGLMNEAMDEQPAAEAQEKTKASKSAKNTANELREYKSLLDDGIITQEEFDKKKAEILGL